MTRFMIFLTLGDEASMTPGAIELAVGMSPWSKIVTIKAPGGLKFDDPVSDEAGDGFLVLADEDPISVMFVPAPLPRDAWEPAVALDRLWPEARATIEASRAHVVIAGLRPKTTHEDVFDRALAVTVIAAALALHLPVTAAIFADSARVVPQGEVIEAANGLAERCVPAELWANIHFYNDEKRGKPRIGAATRGLAPFVGRELELQPSALDLMGVAQRMLGLSEYLITHGPVIGDGETVGLTPDEQIKVRHRARGRWSAAPVLELVA